MTMELTPQTILLALLCIAGAWAFVELALTLRKARTSLDEVTQSTSDLIDQATPVIAKLDGVVDELQPTLKEVPGLVERFSVMADEATISLDEVNNILGDVSKTTHGVAGVGESATRIVGTATSAAVGVVSKVASLGGITIPEGQNLIGKGTPQKQEPPKHAAVKEEPAKAPEPKPRKTTSYVAYEAVVEPVQDSE